jgi:alkaline phosphatase
LAGVAVGVIAILVALRVAPASGIGPTSSAVATSAPEVVTLVGAGDVATCDTEGDEATAALLDEIGGAIFVAGDAVYESGSTEEFDRCYEPSWGRHKDRILFPAPGNHDYLTDGAAGYLAYFGKVAAPSGRTWYSRDLGAWHVVVLDSNCDFVDCTEDSEQVQWLKADLASSQALCTVAIAHHSRFSSGPEHGDTDAVAPFWRALYEARAEIVIGAHDHDYERFAPQDPDGNADPSRGLREFVVGTGGGELTEVTDSRPNAEADEDDTFGVLRLDLRPTDYSWRFVPVTDGEIDDSGEGDCR